MKILFQIPAIFLVIISLMSNNLYAQSVGLCNYDLVNATTINDIPNDLSGITYNPLANTLFMVQNGDPTVYETDLSGNVLREIELKNFEDTEGIVHITGTRFAVVEERRGKVIFFDISSNTNSVNYNNTDKVTLASSLGPWGGNTGLEGITYYPLAAKILTVKEKTPKRYYDFSMPTSFPVTLSASEVGVVCDLTQNPFGFSDVAGIHHLGLSGATDPTTGTHTLLLSEENRVLVEVDADCHEISRLSFSYINQPEGVTMDNNGTIYIVAEPNELYVFNSTSTANCSCPLNLSIPDIPIEDGVYRVGETIYSTGMVAPGGDVGFEAGNTIILNEGFSIEPQAAFSAEIEECDGN